MNKKKKNENTWIFLQRHVRSSDLFDEITIDEKVYYNIKDHLTRSSKWYYDDTLEKTLKYNSIFMHFHFGNEDLPKRCVKSVTELTEELKIYLQKTRVRVSSTKCKMAVKHLVKHISRLKFHKKFAITYSKRKDSWNKNSRLSKDYMEALIAMLEEDKRLYDFCGCRTKSEDIPSMLVVNPSFISFCNTPDKIVVMEDCLRKLSETPSVIIRDKKKKILYPSKEEKPLVNNMIAVMDQYNQQLKECVVTINGISVPELFFRRIGTETIDKGMRLYDDGSIQGENETSRSSITIDGEETIELDYSSLHYAIACEQEGIDLKGKDPYDFEIDIVVDQQKIDEWKKVYSYNKPYNPVRNLKKFAMLIMFNAPSELQAERALTDLLIKDYRKKDKSQRLFVGIDKIPAKELISKIKENNIEVSKYFLTGVGLEFQRKDSDMITYCIQKFMDIGEVCLPVHDSIIVKKSLETFGVECMEEAFEHVMGSKVNCKIK